MLKNADRTLTDKLARAQLDMLHELANELSLTADDLRRVLNLDDRRWRAWTLFRAGGQLPAEPALPEMLIRISEAAHRLALVAQFAATQPHVAEQQGACRDGAIVQHQSDWNDLAAAGRSNNTARHADRFQPA